MTPTLVLDGIIPENLDVTATTTMSKIATPRMAYLQTRKAISRSHGRYLYFQENKYLMGNISADIKAMIDTLHPYKLIFCTSWPEENSLIRGEPRAFNGRTYCLCLKPGSSGAEAEIVRELQFMRKE